MKQWMEHNCGKMEELDTNEFMELEKDLYLERFPSKAHIFLMKRRQI